MTIKHLDRRTMLRGALATGAAVTIPLPLLDIMLNEHGTALAQSATPLAPLYVTWFFGNGTLPGLWKPAKTGVGSAWELSSQLKPLADHKSYLTVVSGLEGKLVVGGVEHPSGSAACTTGAPISGNAVRSESIDQTIAKLLGTPQGGYKSIELGVTPATPNGPQDSLHTVSHNGPSARNMPEFDPKAVFKRLFGDGGTSTPGEPDQAAKMVKVRRSVLDAVLADGARLEKRLGATDKLRIQHHLDAIRDIEARLDGTTAPGAPAACGTQTAPTIGKDAKSEAPPAVNTIMSKLATLALACDKTRVVSYMFSLPAAHVYYRHLPMMDADFHDTICHTDAGDKSTQTRVDTGVQYTMRCLAEFLTEMKSTAYGAGNLLDTTLIYVTSDTAWGKVHDRTEWPVLFVGKAGGRLKGDTHVNFQSENLTRALLAAAQTMGSTATSYGLDNGKVTAALPGIEA
jgi:Protein of unknown function (DUF1552)